MNRLDPCLRQSSTGLELRHITRRVSRRLRAAVYISDVDLKMIKMLSLALDVCVDLVRFRRTVDRGQQSGARPLQGAIVAILNVRGGAGRPQERKDELSVLANLRRIDFGNVLALSTVCLEQSRASPALLGRCNLPSQIVDIAEAGVQTQASGGCK